MSESLTRGASVISVSATDRDVGSNAKLMYSLREQDREHFYIRSVEATNTGVLKVFKVLVVSDTARDSSSSCHLTCMSDVDCYAGCI